MINKKPLPEPTSSCCSHISGKLAELDLHFEKVTIAEDRFPTGAFRYLHSLQLLQVNVPKEYGGLGIGCGHASATLLQILKRIGFHDLSVGRIYEGHINAIQLIHDFGSEDQKHRYFTDCKNGLLFGVWNSELPFESLQLRGTKSGFIFNGAKIFCSGGTNIQRPILTAQDFRGKRMIVLDLDERNLEEDYTYWQPIGMKASVSCRLDFSGLEIADNQILGEAGDYEREPDFSGGAVRFAAVQLGGAEAVILHALQHIVKLKRAEDPHQLVRMGELSILRERGRIWSERAGHAADRKQTAPDEFVYFANMFRIETRNLCEEVLRLAELSVGLQGLLAPHPLERLHRDLSVYLKQPGPDRAVCVVGRYFINNSDAL